MPRKLPLYVVCQRTRHGRIVFYFRRGKGKRIRLPSIDDKAFEAAYHAALTGNPVKVKPAERGTLAWLWDRYTTESAKWAKYSEATRRQQKNIMVGILKKSGQHYLDDFTRNTIQKGVDRRHETPAASLNFLKTMNGLFSWAKRMDLIDENPCVGVEPVRYKTQGYTPWTIEDVEQFRAHHPEGTKPRLALEILLQTGLRRSDIVQVGLQHFRGAVMTMATAKTGAVVSSEFPGGLMALVEVTPRRGLHLIENANGKPFTKESFGNWFRKQAAAAGVGAGKNAHGLRKLSATLAAEGGARSHQLMAQYGWTNLATAEIYTRGADRAVLGVETSRIVAEQIRNRKPLTLDSGEGKSVKKA